MKINVLQMKRVLCAALIILLLSVVGMTNVKAQTPYRQYADNGILLNFHEIDNVDFRVFLLYSLSQDNRFILIANEESGQFSIISNDEEETLDFFDAFESFYQNAYADFSLLSKTDFVDLMPQWKSSIAPTDFVSVMMDISLRNSRSDNNHCINSQFFSPDEVATFEAATSTQTADQLEGITFEDGCIISSYNPSWFHMRINTSGQFIIRMEGHDPNNPDILRDIDFCMWGPFNDPISPCVSQLTSNKIIDCSYSANYTEDAYLGYPDNEHAHNVSHGTVNYHVPQTGEYYILMITNFSRQPCNIKFSKRENFPILFADANVKALCVANWDTDDDGELSYGEAEAVTTLGSVFNNKSSITSFNELQYFTGLTFIAPMAFENCYGLNTIKIPNTVISIESGSFEFCRGLSTIEIPNSVISIGSQAFYGCINLTIIEIPSSVTSIPEGSVDNAFAYCSGLEQIIVDQGNTTYDSRENCNAIINTSTNELVSGCKNTIIPNSVTIVGDQSFGGCSTLTSIEIPNSVISIESNAFGYCTGLTMITIPNSVTNIGGSAFNHCINLSSITVLANNPPVIMYGDAFNNGVNKSIPVYVPFGTVAAYQSALYWSEFTNIQELGNSPSPIIFDDANVKALCVANWDTNGDGELSYFEAATVTDLGSVFNNKTNIISFNELQYFNGLSSIGANAFKSCSSLCSITIPNSVTSIGNNAFFGCASLVSIVIPSSVASIGSEVFRDCPGLMQMKVNANNTVFDSRNNCNAIIETATNKLIYGCKNTVIPNSVTSIGGAFDGCSSLTSITIPSAVTSIGSYAFYGCSRLTSMTVLPAIPPSLGSSVFYNVNKSIPVYVVSCDALVAYRNASGWNEFTNIHGGETFESEFTITTCDGYEWNGQVYTESGNYQQTFTTTLGCDSIVTLHLINNSETEDFTMATCESYTWHGTTYTTSGNYTFNTTTAEGCPRIETLHLTINYSEEEDFNVTECDSYTWHGTNYTQSGTYTFDTQTAQGCPRTETLNLTINQSEEEEFWVTACDYYYWHGTGYYNSGTYTYETTTAQGCQRIEILQLTVNDSYWVEDSHVLCQGGMYEWQGHSFGATAGEFTVTERLPMASGCDSIVTMTVTVNDSYWVEDSHVLCQGGMYEWQGHTFGAEAGTFMVTETLPTASGCDSIVTKIVTVYPSYEVCDSHVLCQGGTYVWQGHSFGATAGEFTVTETLPTVSGCDSIVTMYVNVNPVQTYTDAVTICDDALPYTFHGHVFNAAGTQTGTVPSTVTSCDSTWTLTVNVNPSEYDEEWITECDTYTWHGTAYLQSGSYTYSTYTAQGCERIETLHLTINNSEEEEYTVTASDSYMWHGMTYTQSGTYYYETSTAQGCPRTEILYLTIASNHWTPVGENTSPFSTTLYGIIQINGVEQYSDQLELGIFCGNECRGSAIASEFFLTHRYLVEVNVYGNSGERLTFKLYDHAIHQELSLTPPDAITFTIDGYGNPVNPYVLNFTSSMSITATTAPENAGTVTGTGEYTIGSSCSLTATANPGFQFQNWTLDGTVVSTNPTYTFTVTENANYVAHFQYVQRRTLVSGWNWWSTYIEQEGSNGLEMLENSIGTSGIRIQGKNSSVDYFEYQGTGYWYGSLNTIANEQMYMIRTSAACDAVIVGDVALPENHPITIISGWNWIGYPNAQSVDVNIAMGGFTPEANDVVKGRNSVSTYISYGGYQGWYGQLNTLEPGQGYMYRSYSNVTKTLTFQTGRGGETLANITPENNVFVPNTANYADNMIVTAIIDMDGEELRSEDYELAVFVGNECRGSVRLMYVEPFDRYVALLMAYGEGEEELRFVLTDGKGTSWSNDRVTYTANGMVGTMTEPAIIHFGPLGIEDNIQKPIHVYPNPSKGIFNIEGEGIQKIEVVDAYGQVLMSKEVENGYIQVNLGDKAAGVYLLRVVTDSGIVTHKLVNCK